MIAAALAAGALSAMGAADAGVNACMTEALAWPGRNITVHMELWRDQPRRFVGHCNIDDGAGNRETYRFDVTKRLRNGRWLVLTHELPPAAKTRDCRTGRAQNGTTI